MRSTSEGTEHRWPRLVATIVLIAVVALLAACSGSDDAAESNAAESNDAESNDASASEGDAAGTTTTEAEIERFDGSVEDFYRVPDPLPDGEPGDPIRTMPVDAPSGSTGLRIMYLTTDADGEHRAATGLVYFPEDDSPEDDSPEDETPEEGSPDAAATANTPPEDGWPIVAWAHGTSGLAAQCAPSRSPSPPPDYGIQGVLVAADYAGLGPDGEIHPYLSAAAEGHAVIDSVAAARALPETHAGDEWVVVGVSQGGHAALFTNEMAAERLPEADLVGAAALAPGAELGSSFGDELQANVITTMALVGIAAEDEDVELGDYLGPAALAASEVIETGCVGDIITDMAPVASAADYFVQDPRTSPVGTAWLEQNDPGRVAGAAPLLLVQGGRDILVLPARTAALFARLCGVGQPVDMLEVPTADHDTVTEDSRLDVGAWLRARLEDAAPVDDC